MKTYVSPGDSVTITAPSTVTAGQVLAVGTNMFGVVQNDAASAAPVVLALSGIFEMPAAVTNTVAVVGQFATHDTTNNAISVTAPTTGFVKVGVFTRAKLTTDTTVQVRLNGAF
jgi:predicted RecA/RadA family phage recombinase